MHACDTPFGTLQLDRYPTTSNPTLQPFDAADSYLLQAVDAATPRPESVLVINDNFGALACALSMAGMQVTSWGDSYLAEQALRLNAQANGLTQHPPVFVPNQQAPTGLYTQVLLRIPKSLALLEDQLSRLRPLLSPGATVTAGAMLKHLPPTAGDLLARYIGSYQASLAWKKARLLTARLDPALTPKTPQLDTRYALPGTDITLVNQPGVFSRERLDIGTRVLLPCIPKLPGIPRIIDLGCGNGALGIQAALTHPDAAITFIDESFAAVASAQRNFTTAYPGREATFTVGDGLLDTPARCAELVLCNPPFHQQQVVGDEIALRMFAQSRRALVNGGSLLVVGNRHLGYHAKLRRSFRYVEQVGGNGKFVVLRAS